MKAKINITLTIIFIVLTVTSLFSQYDHRQVMYNQARRMEARRDFDSALEIYEELIKAYPHDSEVAEGYFNVLITLNRFDDAESLLSKYEAAFSSEKVVQNKIMLYGRKGEMDNARRVGLNYLRENPGIINLYSDFSRSYERISQFETALEVLHLSRRQTNDEYLFAIDMARNYQTINKFPEATTEYIKHLERNSGFLFMVADRINNMLDNDRTLAATLSNLLADSDNPVLLELYALTLSHINRYEDAYDIYKQLGPEKLINFADELTVLGNYDLAVRAYEEYHNEVSDPIKKAEVKVKIASILISGKNYLEAENTLIELTKDETIQDRQYRFRTHVNRIVREMLADLYVRMDRPREEIINWLDEAKKFAFNQNEQREIDLRKVRYKILLEDYQEADDYINQIIRPDLSGTRVYHTSFYYRFLLDLMQTNSPSDSLMAEMIIRIPGDDLTNEALFLTVMMMEISPANQAAFLKAYRLKSLYKEEEALYTLLKPASASLDSLLSSPHPSTVKADSLIIAELKSETNRIQDEEILLIAAHWAVELGKFDLAGELYSFPYSNDALSGYAALKRSEMFKAKEKPYRDTVVSFLQDNPHNVLAPQLRLLLTN